MCNRMLQSPSFTYCAVIVVGYLMVLTVETLQVAVGKKDIAYTVLTVEHRLLAQVRGDGGNIHLCIVATITQLSLHPVDTAVARTELAFLHGCGKSLCKACIHVGKKRLLFKKKNPGSRLSGGQWGQASI